MPKPASACIKDYINILLKKEKKCPLFILAFQIPLILPVDILLNHIPIPHTLFSGCQRMLAAVIRWITFILCFEPRAQP